jgi:hypothetical protein
VALMLRVGKLRLGRNLARLEMLARAPKKWNLIYSFLESYRAAEPLAWRRSC